MKLRDVFFITGLVAGGLAKAAPILEARLNNGMPSDTCSTTGLSKCAAYYFRELNLTILSEHIFGSWSSMSAPGSAQEHAETLGLRATGLTGWHLPTLEQYGSLFYAIGPNAWQDQFGSYKPYWSQGPYQFNPDYAWTFDLTSGSPSYIAKYEELGFSAIAVRLGDMPKAVNEPSILALMGAAFLAASLTRRRGGCQAPASRSLA